MPRCRKARSKITYDSVEPHPSAIVYSYMFAYGGCPVAIQRNTSEHVSVASMSHEVAVAAPPSQKGGSLLVATATLVPAVVSAERYATRGQNGAARYSTEAPTARMYATINVL